MRITLLTHFPGRGGSTTFLEQIRSFFLSRAHSVTILVGQDCDQPQISNYRVIDFEAAITKSDRIRASVASIQETKPDLVYSISGTDELDVLRFLAVPRVRHVFSVEQHEYLDMPLALSQMRDHLEGITANTPDVLELLKSISGTSNNVMMAVAPYRFPGALLSATDATTRTIARRLDTVDICFVGRLELFQKRAHLLPEIMERTCAKTSAVRWHVYGDGPLKSLLEKQTAILRSKELVTFHGWMSSDQLRDRMTSHQLFFLCSRWEGLPIAMVEAMLLGLACVVPDIPGGIQYVLKSGGGWIYRAGSVDHSIETVLSAVNNCELLVNQRRIAQESARKMFDPNFVELQLIELEKRFESLKFNGKVLVPHCHPKLHYVSSSVWWKRKVLRLSRVFRLRL